MSNPSPDQHLIDQLARELDNEAKAANSLSTPKSNGHGSLMAKRLAPVPTEMTDERVIELLRGAGNAAKFASLFDEGDLSGHGGDESSADYALLGMLKFYTQDPGQLDQLMR